MDNFPIEPQQIIFIIVFLISALSSLFKKGKKEEYSPEENEQPSFPPPMITTFLGMTATYFHLDGKKSFY